MVPFIIAMIIGVLTMLVMPVVSKNLSYAIWSTALTFWLLVTIADYVMSDGPGMTDAFKLWSILIIAVGYVYTTVVSIFYETH